MRWIVAYDVSAERRRRDVAKMLEHHGTRLQQSVFECDLTPADLDRLLAEIDAVIDPHDTVIASPTCSSCRQRRQVAGSPPRWLPDHHWCA